MTKFLRKHPYEVSSVRELIFDGRIGERIAESPVRRDLLKNEPQYEDTFNALQAWRMKCWMELFDAVFQNFSKAYHFAEKVF